VGICHTTFEDEFRGVSLKTELKNRDDIDRSIELLFVMDDYRLGGCDGIGIMGQLRFAGICKTDSRLVLRPSLHS
jgi:hypothetical protein